MAVADDGRGYVFFIGDWDWDWEEIWAVDGAEEVGSRAKVPVVGEACVDEGGEEGDAVVLDNDVRLFLR